MKLLFGTRLSWQVILLFVWSFFHFALSNAQKLSTTDSLELNRLFNYSFQDSCSYEVRYSYLDSIADFSDSLGYAQGLIEMHYAKARILKRNNKYEEALETLSEGLMLCYQFKNPKRERDILLESVSVFLKLSLNEIAATTGENLLTKGLYNSEDSAILFNNIGIAYYHQNALDKGLENFIQSIAIHKKNKDTLGMASVINNIGMVYERTNNINEALEHYHQSSKLYYESGELENYTIALSNIGSLYIHQNEHQKAIEYYEKAEVISDSINYKMGIANIHFNYAIIYQIMGDYDKSNAELKQSIKSFKQLGAVNSEIECLTALGQNYKETKQYHLALTKYKQALSMASTQSDMRLLILISEELSQVYEAQLNYKASLHYLSQSKLYNDTLQRNTNKSELENLKLAYQTSLITEQFEQTLKRDRAILDMEINNQKRLTYTFLVAFIVFVGLFIWAIRNQITINHQNKKLKQSNEAKHQLLSIIGHDLRGPVGTLVSFIEMILLRLESLSREELHKYLSTLKLSTAETYNLLENLLFWAQSEKGEMAYKPQQLHIVDVCDQVYSLLRESASKDDVTILINCEPELRALADENMLKTVLRNLVSNALKFTPAGGNISINVNKEGQHTLFSVIDTGVGMQEEIKNALFKHDEIYTSKGLHQEGGTGLGLNLCLKFVKQHQGKIWVESELDKGTSVYFTIPH